MPLGRAQSDEVRKPERRMRGEPLQLRKRRDRLSRAVTARDRHVCGHPARRNQLEQAGQAPGRPELGSPTAYAVDELVRLPSATSVDDPTLIALGDDDFAGTSPEPLDLRK